MFDKFMQGLSAKTRRTASAEELTASPTGLSIIGNGAVERTASPETASLSSFDEIYHKSGSNRPLPLLLPPGIF